jgi:thioester reductase-like protein
VNQTSYESIFLTGATGVLGAQLLKQLLKRPKITIYCLVRSTSATQAKDRLKSFLRIYDPAETLLDEFNHRVQVVLGDLTQENLGLLPFEYDQLAQSVDITLHSAACTNLFLNWSRIEPINVGGVRNILKFVMRTKSRYLSYISTYTVMGDKVFDESFIFKECHFDVGQSFSYMTYQQSKFVGETIIREAEKEGLVWNIIRPGQIFGESETGFYPQGCTHVSGLFLDIFKTILETGIAIDSKTYYDVVPVDYVGNAVLYLSLERHSFFQTYHLTNPDIKTYFEVISILRSFGYPIQFVSQAEYKRILLHRELKSNGKEYKSPTTSAFKWWLQREPFNFEKSAITDCSFTYSILNKKRIHCPKIEQNLIWTYIEEGIRRNYFPRPSSDRRMNPESHNSEVAL